MQGKHSCVLARNVHVQALENTCFFLRCCRMLPHALVLDHVSPATRLLEKRRQMFEVQEALEAQKQEFNRKVKSGWQAECM
jgi:hypothetical protein